MVVLEKVPFVRYSDKKVSDTFTIRLNEKERVWLEEIKEDLNIAQDGRALKLCAWIGRNVLHSLFGRRFMKYLFKKERSKLEDFKDF